MFYFLMHRFLTISSEKVSVLEGTCYWLGKTQQNLDLKGTVLFTSMEHWAKGLFVRIQKDGLLAELQTRMSRSRRFLLFLPHN